MDAISAYREACKEFDAAQRAVAIDRSKAAKMSFSLAWNKRMAAKVAAYGVPPREGWEAWSRL
jgi:hypothetical protein